MAPSLVGGFALNLINQEIKKPKQMIKRFDTYTVICDNCGVDHNEDQEISGWSDDGYAEDCARESDWHCEDGKHYCDKCWSYDDNDEIQLRKIEKPKQ